MDAAAVPALQFPSRRTWSPPAARETWAAAALLLLLTLAARINSLGDPGYHVDETFYMLVGNAMHHGAVPYVDIWDRKPPGLFVLFWLFGFVSPSVLSFQVAAIGFTTATAVLVSGIARRWTDRTGALLAGAFYVAWLQPLLGGGGQAPVFYNLFVVGAVALLVRDGTSGRPAPSPAAAVLAATLCGIAVSIKPTAVCEGAFVVLAFAWRQLRSGEAAGRTAALLAAMAAVAALPTLLPFAWFAWRGDFATYWHAVVVSNFLKTGSNPAVFRVSVRYLFLLTLLLTSSAALGLLKAREERRNPPFARLMLAWLLAAIAGFLAVPNFYSHYALSLVPVLSVCAAPWFGQRPLGRVLAACAILWALAVGQSFDLGKAERSQERYAAVIAVIRDNMANGRLYVFDGPPWLYQTTGAHPVSRFVFPEHLSMATEARAIGVDPAAELGRVLAQRPDVIVTTSTFKPDVNRTTLAILRETLSRDYQFVCSLPGRDFEHRFRFEIFARTGSPDRGHCPLDAAANVSQLRKT